MNLKEVNEQLEDLMPEYIKAQEEYSKFMYEYDNYKAKFSLSGTTLGLGNQTMRDAEVMRRLDVEGLLEKKLKISSKFYRLKTKKEFLFELSSNLRTIGAK
jgi:hypothetical protein